VRHHAVGLNFIDITAPAPIRCRCPRASGWRARAWWRRSAPR
jgi:hypothetical protein